MTTRSAEVKGYVLPEVKAQATELYAHWGMSLSDAINIFLVKSIDTGGLPFDVKLIGSPRFDESTVIPVNPQYGSSILPIEMDDEENGLYDCLVN